MDSKANYQKMKRQITERKTFANHLITITHKLNVKKNPSNPIEKKRHFLRVDIKGSVRIFKTQQQQYSEHK